MIPKVKVSVGDIRKRRKLLFAKYFELFGSKDSDKLDQNTLSPLSHATADVLGCEAEKINEALVSYIGRNISPDLLYHLAAKFAGGRNRIKAGKELAYSLMPFVKGNTWLAVHIDNVEYAYWGGTTKVCLHLTVYSGEFAGIQFKSVVPLKYYFKIFSKVLGFPFKDISSMRLGSCVQMLFLGWFSFDAIDNARLLEGGILDNMRIHNNKLRALRDRVCPNGYKQPCVFCARGYFGAHSCFRACRKLTQVFHPCSSCHNPNALYTPGKSILGMCDACRNRKADFAVRMAVNL